MFNLINKIKCVQSVNLLERVASAKGYHLQNVLCGKKKCKKNKPKKPKLPLKGRVALITGGGGTIGLECAKQLLRNGVEGVTIAEKSICRGENAVKEIGKEFGPNRAIFCQCDVMKSELLDWAFKNTLKNFERLDIVINNAGILNEKRWENEVAINFGSCIVGSLLGVQYMSKACTGCGGVVINLASTIGITPLTGCPIYSATQSAIIGLTRALGEGCHIDRTDVKVMGLCVGMTDSPLLLQAPDQTLNDHFKGELETELQELPAQEPECVARALIKVICKGEAGSLWVIECGSDAYEIEIPCHDKMKIE